MSSLHLGVFYLCHSVFCCKRSVFFLGQEYKFICLCFMQLKNDLEKLEKQVQENSQMRVALQKELEESQKGKQDSVSCRFNCIWLAIY